MIITINYKFSSYRKTLEKCFSKNITPKKLLKEGFIKSNKSTYKKSFSNLLSLTFFLNDNSKVTYKWDMNENNFKKINKELKSVIEYFDKEIETFYFETTRGKGSNFRRHLKKIMDFKNKFYKIRNNFLDKYEDFFNINSCQSFESAYIQYEYFFFDACNTTSQLHLYFEFIELFISFARGIEKSKNYVRKITEECVKQGISSYYTYFFTIKKIRKLWSKNCFTFEELKKKFSIINEKTLEKILLDSQNKKGWEYLASQLSLDFAAYTANTTIDNFKQILKKEKKFALEIKKTLSKYKNIEMVLSGKINIPLPKIALNFDFVPEDDSIALFKHSVLHL